MQKYGYIMAPVVLMLILLLTLFAVWTADQQVIHRRCHQELRALTNAADTARFVHEWPSCKSVAAEVRDVR